MKQRKKTLISKTRKYLQLLQQQGKLIFQRNRKKLKREYVEIITERKLQEMGACDEAIVAFKKSGIKHIDSIDLLKKMITKSDDGYKILNWASWLIAHTMTHEQRLAYAKFAYKVKEKADNNRDNYDTYIAFISAAYDAIATVYDVDKTAGDAYTSYPSVAVSEKRKEMLRVLVQKGIEILNGG